MRRWLPCLVLLSACAPAQPPGTVFYASGADLQSINPLVTTHPLAKQVQRYALFATLVRLDSALRLTPYLAESWAWSADRRALTFRLRGDVPWHDGSPTSSRDAQFTLEAARDPAVAYPRAADLACVTAVEAPDARTLRLRFCRPQQDVPDVLTDLALLPAHLLDTVPRARLATAAFNRHPVGNGPFRFVSYVPNRRWVFEANPDFPLSLGGPPLLPRFVIQVVDEPTTKLAALVSGELDVAGIAPMHAAVVRQVAERRVLDYPLLLSYGLVFNTARAPFDDVSLRRALLLALDRAQMVAVHVFGFGEPAAGPVPAVHPLALRLPPPRADRATARRMLDALGWRAGPDGVRHRDGKRLAFTLLTVGSAENVLEQLVQADLAAVGVEVRIRQLELGAFLAAAQSAARDYDALVTGIPGDLALGHLRALFDSRERGGPLQYAQYADAALDRALDAGDVAQVQRIVAEDVPIAFLYHARGVQGLRTRLGGVRMDLRGELPTLAQWHLVPEAR